MAVWLWLTRLFPSRLDDCAVPDFVLILNVASIMSSISSLKKNAAPLNRKSAASLVLQPH